MKKNILIMMILLLLPTFVSANEIGEFKRTINLSLNCDYCKEGIEKTATFQLFANDEIVEDAVITLDESNEFKDYINIYNQLFTSIANSIDSKIEFSLKDNIHLDEYSFVYNRLLESKENIKNKNHVQNIKNMKENIDNNICPRCGSPLVKRQGKHGGF